jgi:hypothetical protein
MKCLIHKVNECVSYKKVDFFFEVYSESAMYELYLTE